MSILGWVTAPYRAYRSLCDELKAVRAGNRVKLAYLNARIQDGDITGAQLDAVTECLEAQSVNIKKRETDRLKGDSK